MKKKMIKPLLAIACLLCSISASAYDFEFEVDGINYSGSDDDLKCIVIAGKNPYVYSHEIVIPSHVTYEDMTLTVVGIRSKAFYGCENLTKISIPNTISQINDDAFTGCYRLWTVIIEDGDTDLYLGESAEGHSKAKGLFYDCPLNTVYLGRNLWYVSPSTNSDYSPFCGGGVNNVVIGNSVTKIGDYLFRGCKYLDTVVIGNSVAKIGRSAFEKCSSLKKIVIPNSVTEIGDNAFNGCSYLEDVTIGNSVTYISSWMFHGCKKLSGLTIPNSVTNIYIGAFEGTALTSLYSLNPTPPRIGEYNFTGDQYRTTNVYVPEEALEAYQNAEKWKGFRNLQGFDPTGIKDVEVNGVNRNGKYYDLRGNKLDAPKRGINIINGKKVMIK